MVQTDGLNWGFSRHKRDVISEMFLPANLSDSLSLSTAQAAATTTRGRSRAHNRTPVFSARFNSIRQRTPPIYTTLAAQTASRLSTLIHDLTSTYDLKLCNLITSQVVKPTHGAVEQKVDGTVDENDDVPVSE